MTKTAQPPAPPVLLPVVQQHAEEAALLRHTRGVLVRAPHVGLALLARHDERIEAHLDGLLVAGAAGASLARAAFDEEPGTATAFVAAVLALRQRDDAAWAELLARATPADTGRAVWRGLVSALGWVTADTLQGVVRKLMTAPDAAQRALAVEACRMHRVDPGPLLVSALADRDSRLRACALRAAGDLARQDLLAPARSALADGEPEVVFQAACAACRLGERQASMQVLLAAAHRPGPEGERFGGPALALVMAASTPAAAREVARDLSAAAQSTPTPATRRRLVRALALLGDTRHVPWLIERMQDPALARPAGEAFSWITGIDLASSQLEQLEPPAGAAPAGPSEDPADDDMALDEDADLPWPDAARVQAAWERQPASGERLFAGAPQSDAAAMQRVLREGTQRQRRHAALLAALLQPDATLLPVAAPAWRQRRWLAAAAPG
jgi:uncharacterized protein (TIGR02270 family)